MKIKWRTVQIKSDIHKNKIILQDKSDYYLKLQINEFSHIKT